MSTSTTVYKTKLTIPYGKLRDIIEWCQSNSEHDWKYDIINIGGKDPGLYEFVFDDEKDYVKFLMWKK